MQSARLLPAEWAPQAAVLLTWPHDAGDWGTHLPEVEDNFFTLARTIARFQPLLINCRDQFLANRVRQQLLDDGVEAEKLHMTVAPSNDVWARDHGPITVLDNGQPRLFNFCFNGWGGKFEAGLDNRISEHLHAQGCFGSSPIETVDWVLEGGAIETDGHGVMLTTTHCLPLPTRNPGKSLEEFEQLFHRIFGIQTTHWLNHGHLTGDDTDGHIDTLARFASTDSIVYQGCNDPQDEDFPALDAMREELEALRQPDGKPYRLHALPLPAPIHDEDGQRLPASYANFLIINGAVLLPVYNDPADTQATETLRRCFPDREIICVDCRALIRQYGSLHCVTMQIPAGVTVSSPANPALTAATQA